MIDFEAVVTADWHNRWSQFSRMFRRLDFLAASNHVVKYAMVNGIKVIFHGGDILETTQPHPQVFEDLAELHCRLIDHGIVMYVVEGNHDHVQPHWIDLIRRLSRREDQNFGIKLLRDSTVPLADGRVMLHGLGGGDAATLRDAMVNDHIWPDKVNILLCHAPVMEFAKYKKPDYMSAAEFSAYPLTIVGDIHVHENVVNPNGSIVLSPGSTEMCKMDEPQNKAFYHIKVKGDGSINFTSVPIPIRKVIRGSVMSEDKADQVLEEIRKFAAASPIVDLKYLQTLTTFPSRVFALLDPEKCIINIPAVAPNYVEGQDLEEIEEDQLKPEDLLPLFNLQPNSLALLARQLLIPDVSASNMIDEYIAARTLRGAVQPPVPTP